MRRYNLFLVPLLVIFLSTSLWALPPESHTYSNKDLDSEAYFDANNILMFVSNVGWLARDNSNVFGKTDGFYYPFNGDINDILDGTQDNTLLYTGGLWMGGKVGNDIRVVIAGFDSEYVPGPMAGFTYQPDNPSFRVYKIDQSSGPGDPDYDNWPSADGAPVDDYGDPLLMGDQTFWAVYNDADPSAHNSPYGSSDPLAVEVQQTVWGSDDPGDEDEVYVKYLLYNNGNNYIDSFFISFWADPDIGGPSDDLVGCDSVKNMFFAYNGRNFDDDYSPTPPAWGGKVISGPVVYSPGDVADFNGSPLIDYKNIGMTSFNKYINGTDPYSPEEIYNYMKGFDLYGDPIINPLTGLSTKYSYSGDPVTGQGWYDQDAIDCRLMVSFGPFNFAPGDSQQLVIKFGAKLGNNRLHSLSLLKNTLDASCPVVDPFESGGIYYVSTLGSDIGGDGSETNPFATIQYAVDQAGQSDTIIVEPGIYNETIEVYGKSLVISSRYLFSEDRSDIMNTVVYGDQNDPVFLLDNVDGNAFLNGFTIKNGNRGIKLVHSDMTVSNNIIVENSHADLGGGVYCLRSEAHLLNNTICNNSALNGGGILLYRSDPLIEKCIIAFNNADYCGALLCYLGTSNPELVCCDVYGNSGGDYMECIEEDENINDNFSSDPWMCGFDNGDYYISESSICTPENSPCGELVGAGPIGLCEPRAVLAIDRSGSMVAKDLAGNTRLERALQIAHSDIDKLLDNSDPDYPGHVKTAVIYFNESSITVAEDFTHNAELLHSAIDAIPGPAHSTPLAAAMCQAHCMLDYLSPYEKYVFTYTDGLENNSIDIGFCDLCQPCNDMASSGWNFDCNPATLENCTDWQLCLLDKFSEVGTNVVHYFGDPINPFEDYLSGEGLEDMYFLIATAGGTENSFYYYSDNAPIAGDVNGDIRVDIGDAVYLINYVFVPDSPEPVSMESANVNCDEIIDISDAVYLINYVFVPESPAPCDSGLQ